MLISVFRPAPAVRTVRALVAGLALVLALFQIAAAGHLHDRRTGGPLGGHIGGRPGAPLDTHACTLCDVLLDEVPAPRGLPPLIADCAAHWYGVVCDRAGPRVHGRPPVKPAGCGPPRVPV